MTDSQRHDVREAMGVMSIYNERLNTALANNAVATLNGDATIASFVVLLYSKLTFAPYKDAVEALAGELGINLSAPAVVVPTQANSGATFDAAEIKLLGDLNFSARAALGHKGSLVDRLLVLAAALKDGTWSQWQDADRDFIVDLMGSTTDGVWPENRVVLEKFASAIGVHVDTIAIPTPAPAPAPAPEPAPVPPASVETDSEFEAQVLAVLEKYGELYLRGGKMGLGEPPLQDTDARITLKGGQIVGTNDGNAQNPVRHENCLDICNSDGGMRFLQYGRWFQGKLIRNTTNRRQTNLGLDSKGDLCSSHIDVGATSDGGQSWYIRTVGPGVVEFCTYKVGGVIRILKSLFTYSDTAGQQL